MKKKHYIILAFFTVLLTFLSYQYLSALKEINKSTEALLSYVDPGNKSPESAFLAPNSATMLEIVDFLRNEKLVLQEKSSVKLTGLKTATQTLVFELEEKPLKLKVDFKKDVSGWKISQFPHLEVYSQAIITNHATSNNEVDFIYAGNNLKRSINDIAKLQPQEVYLLVSLEGKIIFSTPLQKKSITKIIAFDGKNLETEKEGLLSLGKQVHYYDLTKKTPAFQSQQKPIVGQKNIVLYLHNGKVKMIGFSEKHRPDKIRVALNRGAFEGLKHSEIQLSSAGGLRVEEKVTDKALSFSPSETLTFKPVGDKLQVSSSGGKTFTSDNRLFITSRSTAGINVKNLSRGQGTPIYPGHLEIKNEAGSLILLNELPLEKYLYTVVASEMPSSFGLAALKVQAIAARSYALNGMAEGNYAHLGAHLEDSVLSQVFNNNTEVAIVNEAVNGTRGKALFFEDKAIDAKFFSTSSGLTANAHEVWHAPGSKRFPGHPVPYLQAKSQLWSKPDFSLTTEEQFKTFFASPNNLSFDRESPWFRWEVEMTGEQLRPGIESNLATRYAVDPDFILTKTEQGYKSEPIPENPIGTLKDLKIVRRGAGGNIMELQLVGSNGIYSIRKELNIRYILSPKNFLTSGEDIELKRWDGSVVKNYGLLPSSFFSVYLFSEMQPQALTKIIFFGGGNGHGVGMSQWGVKGMLAQGQSQEKILEHYYPGTILRNIYEE